MNYDPFDPRFREHLEWLHDNIDPDFTLVDAIESLAAECGLTADGQCRKAGSEECDFECPFRS